MEERIANIEQMIGEIKFTLENHEHKGFDGTKKISSNSFGTYTPTGTAVTNIDSVTPGVSSYIKMGNIIVVSGTVDFDPTSATTCQFRISLPVPSDFSVTADCSGCLTGSASQAILGSIIADLTNNEATITVFANSASSQSSKFIFMYKVI